MLWEALADAPDVDMAFVYGSLAAGDDRPDSNVDVMVVGEISGRRLASLIREAERTTRRTINEVRYSREEFARRAREAGGFLSRVLDRPRVLLKGDEHALRALAG